MKYILSRTRNNFSIPRNNFCIIVSLEHISHLFLGFLNFFWKHLDNMHYISSCLLSEAVAQKCSVRKDVLRNFAKLTGKLLCQSLFLIKLQASGLLKKSLWHRCFPVNFAEFLRAAPFRTEFNSIYLFNK